MTSMPTLPILVATDDPNGGKSPLLESSATKYGRKVGATAYAATIPDENHSQLAPTSTGTIAAATLVSDKKKRSSDVFEDVAPHRINPSGDATDPTPFEHKPSVLASLVDPKSLQSLEAMGGVDGLLRGLGTDASLGLGSWQHTDSGQRHDLEKGEGGGAGTGGDTPMSRATVGDRRRIYGVNQMSSQTSKGLLLWMWSNLKDTHLVFLSVAAAVELVLGFYFDPGTPREGVLCDDDMDECAAPPIGWVEGVVIMIAVLFVVIISSFNDWQMEHRFHELSDKENDRGIKVVRDGKEQVIKVKDVMVGDIALLEPGEIIPCDGVFLRGHNVRCDESGCTGESDAIKVTYEECLAETRNLELGETPKLDCFIVSGAKVLEGVGWYVVIAVGPNSFNGRIMAALSRDIQHTPLQLKLKALTELIERLGYGASAILFTCLIIKAFVWSKANPDQTTNDKAATVLRILTVCVTLTVIAVPEGLSLAVGLVLAFAAKRMIQEGLLVPVLGSCEVVANASVICTDKTGTLTQNVMSVVAGSFGIYCKFVQGPSENEGRRNVDRVVEDVNSERARSHMGDFLFEMSDLNTIIYEPFRSLLNEALIINSTAFEDKNPETGELEFIGSQTEAALLRFAKRLKWAPCQQTRSNAIIVQMIPFSSDRKSMGVVVRASDNKYCFYLKGASEIVTKLCNRHVIVHRSGSEAQADSKAIETTPITELEEENISRTINLYGDHMLRTLAIAYREFESWPPAGHAGAIDEVPYEMIANELTLIGIVGIEDPLRPGVKEAVTGCQGGAGITVKMCTGDSLATACSIASHCGILTAGGIVMVGRDFCRLSPQKWCETAPHLQVLARSSPEDKRILVDTLKDLGEVVSVTIDGTNEGPALKHADIGFSPGVAGTKIAKETSDVVPMSANSASIVSAIMWGCCVHDSTRKFLQFHVPVNVTALLVTFISAIASDKQVSFLAAVQLLWINIVMGGFAALALTADPVSPALLKRLPDRKTAPLFSVDMGKMIVGQTLYQTIIILLLHFVGPELLGYHTEKEHVALLTMVFNTFVFCQIFNLMNCRSLTQDQNIFRGLTKNWCFIVITLIEVMLQVLIVSFGGAVFQVTPMDGHEWGMSVALGFVSIPLGFLIRCIPTPPIEHLFVALYIMRDPQAEDRDSDDVAHKWGKESV